MTNLVVSQVVQEVVSSGAATSAITVSQVVQEVASVGAPVITVSQVVQEVLYVDPNQVYVSQVVMEVLSSSTPAVFDPTVAFVGITPNWDHGVTERWQWLTDVQTAISGDQVRVSLRPSPRLSMEFTVVDDTFGYLLDAILAGWQGEYYYIPAWRDMTMLGTAIAAGTTSIPLDNTNNWYDYEDGGLVAIWTDPLTYEIGTLLYARDPNTNIKNVLILAAGTANAWPASANIAPVRKARLNPNASASRQTGLALEATLTFDCELPVPFAAAEWDSTKGGPWVSNTYALFSHEPNWGTLPKVEYVRRLREFDNNTGYHWKNDPSGRGWLKRTHTHTLEDRPTIQQFLGWAAQRAGRQISYLAPVWETQLSVTRNNAAADTTLYVKSLNYTGLFPAINGRNYIALKYSGGWIVRKVLTVAAASATEEVLTLDAAIGVVGTPTMWNYVLWAEVACLSSDTLELKWVTPAIAEASITHEQVKA